MTDLISHFERTVNKKGFTVERSTKKKSRKKIKDEVCTSATFFENNEGKLIFLPKDLSRDGLAIKVMELQKKLNLYQPDSSTETSVDIAAETIRKAIKSYKSTLNWPPHIQNLELDKTVMPMYLNRLLCTLFNNSNSKNEIRINSVVEDILYTVSNCRFSTTKLVLLPFTIKSLTGNAELVKIMNRLGHGVSHNKVLEIETTITNSKLSSSTTPMPNDIMTFTNTSPLQRYMTILID